MQEYTFIFSVHIKYLGVLRLITYARRGTGLHERVWSAVPVVDGSTPRGG